MSSCPRSRSDAACWRGGAPPPAPASSSSPWSCAVRSRWPPLPSSPPPCPGPAGRGRRRAACSVLTPRGRRDPSARAALAVTPPVGRGTVGTERAPARSTLLLHVFDLPGGRADFIRHYKGRYERPLQEIFE